MFTIQIRSIKKKGQGVRQLPLFVLLSGLAVVPVLAQTTKTLDWPKTFSGQPDFVFMKDAVVKEALKRAQDEGGDPPAVATLDDLLSLTQNLKPLQLDSEVQNIHSEAQVDTGVIQFEKSDLLKVNTALPDVLKEALLDVSEFKVVLQNAATMAVKKSYIDLKKYQFEQDLARLTLQAVVTSPEKYAIINNRRYHENDLLHVVVPVPLDLTDIAEAVNVHMPQEGSISEERFKQYSDARDEILATVEGQLKSGTLKKQQRIAIKIIEIASRKVVFNVGGKTYDLEIKYQL